VNAVMGTWWIEFASQLWGAVCKCHSKRT
jgi:hypothetical protein